MEGTAPVRQRPGSKVRAYQAAIDAYGQVEPYVTIQAAELQHIEALIRRLSRTRRASQDSHLPMFEAAATKDGTLTAEEMQALHR